MCTINGMTFRSPLCIWISAILDNLESSVFNVPCLSPLLSVDVYHILLQIFAIIARSHPSMPRI